MLDPTFSPTAEEVDQLVRTAMLIRTYDYANKDGQAIAVPAHWWPDQDLAGAKIFGVPCIRLDGIDKPVLLLSAFGAPKGLSR